jgi:hypothetical protein
MCVTLLVASLVVAAGSTAMQIDSANYQAGMTKLQLNEQQEQMRKEQENVRLQAQEAEIARLEEYRQLREANLAGLAASGVGQNMSFTQGMEVASERALRRDLANIRLGKLGGENRIAQQIRVNRTQLAISQANKKSAIIGAGLNFVGSAIQAGNIYSSTAVPKSSGSNLLPSGGAIPSTGGGFNATLKG